MELDLIVALVALGISLFGLGFVIGSVVMRHRR